VVGDVKHAGLAAESGPEMYTPFAQTPWASVDLVVRMAPASPAEIARAGAAALRTAVRQVDPEQAVSRIQSLPDLLAGSASRTRFVFALLALFAGLALLLSCLGLYGVLSWSVGERTHEIGIRMALGARPRDVLRQVFLEGMAPVAAGLILGLAAARLLGGLLADQLYDVRAGDPLAFTVAALVVLAAGLVATYFPAHRATQVDPLTALREE